MKLVIVAFRDSAVKAFGTPMFVPAVGAAIRSFGDEVNRKAQDNQFAAHPEDFELFEIGAWDSDTCVFEILPQPRPLARGVDLVRG